MDDGKVQRVVAVRAHLPVTGGLAGGEAGARIDVGAAHPVRQRRHEGLGLLDHERFDDVAAVQHEVLGVLQVEHERLMAEAVDRPRGVVDVAAAAGVVVEVVRRAQRLHEGPGQVVERSTAIRQRDAARTELVDRLVQLAGDVIERLVPRHAPPLAAATRAGADQRHLRPLVVILEGQTGRPFRAQARTEGLVVGVALKPRHPTVLHRHLDRAAHRAHAAHAVHRAPPRGVHTTHVRCHERTHAGSFCAFSSRSTSRSCALDRCADRSEGPARKRERPCTAS